MSYRLDRPILKVKEPPLVLPEADEAGEPETIAIAPQPNRETKRVYMVFGESGDIPKVMHRNRGLAQREAMRLALLNPGLRFHVLVSWRCYASAEA